MPKTVLLFLALAFLFGGAKDTKGQVGADELRSNWQLGNHRGSLHLRISHEEKEVFGKFMDQFANVRSFVKISSADGPVLSGREFVSDWYRRPDGVTIFVTDITAPEKMRVIFYDKKGGEGAVEAEQVFVEFKSLSSIFRRYE